MQPQSRWVIQTLNNGTSSTLLVKWFNRDQICCSGSQYTLNNFHTNCLVENINFQPGMANCTIMVILYSWHMFESNIRRRCDRLLDNNSIRHKTNLDLLDNDPWNLLWIQSFRIPICGGEISRMIIASYSALLLEEGKSSLKEEKHRCHQEHTILLMAHLLDQWKNRRTQGTIPCSQLKKSPHKAGLHTKARIFRRGWSKKSDMAWLKLPGVTTMISNSLNYKSNWAIRRDTAGRNKSCLRGLDVVTYWDSELTNNDEVPEWKCKMAVGRKIIHLSTLKWPTQIIHGMLNQFDLLC